MTQSLSPSPGFPRPSQAPAVRRTTAYWLAALLAASGVIAAIVWGVLAILALNDHVSAFTRVSAPGEVSIQVEKAGQYVVYFEGPGSATIEQLALAVSGPRGESVPLQPHVNGIRYDGLHHAGQSVARFQASEAGRYRLKVGAAVPGVQVAVGDSFTFGLIVTILGIVLLLLATNGGAIAIAVLAYRRAHT